jgi:hypothetical protein
LSKNNTKKSAEGLIFQNITQGIKQLPFLRLLTRNNQSKSAGFSLPEASKFDFFIAYQQTVNSNFLGFKGSLLKIEVQNSFKNLIKFYLSRQ